MYKTLASLHLSGDPRRLLAVLEGRLAVLDSWSHDYLCSNYTDINRGITLGLTNTAVAKQRQQLAGDWGHLIYYLWKMWSIWFSQWSPIWVLTRPNVGKLRWMDERQIFHRGMVVDHFHSLQSYFLLYSAKHQSRCKTPSCTQSNLKGWMSVYVYILRMIAP